MSSPLPRPTISVPISVERLVARSGQAKADTETMTGILEDAEVRTGQVHESGQQERR